MILLNKLELSLGRALMLAGALCLLLTISLASAQSYPSKPIRLVVGFGPGGVADIVARTVAPRLAEQLGQQVVVENRPSAGGIAAAESVARAEPDGHTLLLISNGNVVSSALFKSLSYDPVNDFAMISTLGYFGLVIVADPKLPAKNINELIAMARAKPGAYNFGTVNVGSTQHLAAELFRSLAGIDVQSITYKATPELFAALRNQDIQATFEIIAPMLSNIRAGNMRALAVTTSRRFPGLPEVPTAIESGLKEYDVASWNGLAAPAKTPRAVIERLHQEAVKVVTHPDLQKRFLELGVEARASTPAELREFFIAEATRWGRVIERAKIEKR